MKLPIRQPTQERDKPWPFLYSVVPGRGIVKNVKPKRTRILVETKKPRKGRVYVLGVVPPARW